MPIREQIVLEGVNKTDGAFRGVKKNLKGLETSSKGLGNSFSSLQKTLIGIGAALGTGAIGRSIIATTAQFEDLRTSLSSVTGSAENGAKAFGFVTKFATRTQFSVEDLSKAYIKLKAAGIEPTEELLTTFTDTAAITTDQVGSLEAVTDLFARTVSGGLGLEEIQRLGDRGVPILRILEEQLGLTRAQISEYGKTAEGAREITEAFGRGIKKEFGGATANLVNNLSTQFSNLGIASRNAQDLIGQGGLSDALKDVTKDMTAAIEANEELFLAIGSALGSAVRGTAAAVGFLIDNIQILKALGMGAIAFAAAKAFQRLAVGIGTATAATVRFNKFFRKNIIGILVAAGVAAAEFFGLFDKAFGGEADRTEILVDNLERITDKFGDLKNKSEFAFGTIQDEARGTRNELEFMMKELEATIAITEAALRQAFDDSEQEQLMKELKELTDQYDMIKEAVDGYWQALNDVPVEEIIIKANEVLKEQISLFDRLSTQSIEKYKESLGKLSDEKLFEKALTPTQKEKQSLQKRLADIEEFKNRGLITEEEFQRRKQQIIFDSDKKIIDLAKQRRIKELQIQGLSEEDAKNFADFERKTALEKGEFAISEGKKTFEALGQMNRDAFRAYKAFAIAEAIVSTYKGAAKAIGSYPPPFNFIAAAAVVAGGLAQVNAIKQQQYSGRAMGGPVGAGQTYMVGERGVETFKAPPGGGEIVPNGQGAGGVVINFNVEAIDSDSFQDALAENKSAIVSIVNEAVNDSGRRSLV